MFVLTVYATILFKFKFPGFASAMRKTEAKAYQNEVFVGVSPVDHKQ